MIIGVPKEIKNNEYRVGLTPTNVRELVQCGHQVLIESGAGVGSGFSDSEYSSGGGVVLVHVNEIYRRSELIVKVKEPQPSEVGMMRAGQTLFTFLHLASNPSLIGLLVEQGVNCFAYECVVDSAGRLPILVPMSEIAGKLAVVSGSYYMGSALGGCGVLLGGSTGVRAGNVVVLGGGVVGTNAIRMALGLGARVCVLDTNVVRLRELEVLFDYRIETRLSNRANILESLVDADLVIGAVLVPGGASAPKLLSVEDLKVLRRGAVLVDVAIDQGGCFSSSRPTNHDEPVYIESGIVHYCVANMPGTVAYTSTVALTNATLPYIKELASGTMLVRSHGLESSLVIWSGSIRNAEIEVIYAEYTETK